MWQIFRFVLIVAALLLSAPSDAFAQLSPEARTKVENAIAFLAHTGDPGDLDTAARLRNMLDDGRIEIGVPRSAADSESLAWAEDETIYINGDRVGRPRPVDLEDYSEKGRNNWEEAFDLAATLTHELTHVESDTSVTFSNIKNIGGVLANAAEIEGWRAGTCASVRWLESLAAQLPDLPPADRAELAWRLGDSVNSLSSGLTSFKRYLGKFSDFSEAGWCKPGGGVFSTETEAEQYFADYLARVQKIGTEARAEAQATRPQCCLGDGDGPWFCCQWMHPTLRTQTCAPGKNRPLCMSYEQGKAVDNAICTEVQPGVAGCKPM